jgi:hypothetical protein
MNDFYEKIATEQSLGNQKYNPEEIRKKLENDLFKQDIDAKKDFFRFIKLLTVAWSAAIWLTLYFVGKYRNGFYLSDTIVCTLLKATFFAIIGLPVVAAHHFFPKRK